MSSFSQLRRLGAATLAAGALLLAPVATAVGAPGDAPPGTPGATPVTGVIEAPRPAFYEPPASIPSAPGTIIRQEPARQLLDPLGLSSRVVDARLIMYSSTDRSGAPIAVTGTVFVPTARWIGLSSRPVISYAPGTQGMADRCAPSRTLAESVSYEHALIKALLARGYAVAMTDYQGLGTPGSHTYMNRQAQGQAVLDMARAAKTIPGLRTNSPIGLMGYSQGGGAAAAALELARGYAPDLSVRGAVVGAVPADLARVGLNLDGSLWSAFNNFAMVGLAEGYGLDLSEVLNERGMAAMEKTENTCVLEFGQFAFQNSGTLTRDGRPTTAYLAEEPWASVVADNRIGTRRPSAPVLVNHSLLDDTIPYAVGRQLAQDWCRQGGNVSFSTNAVPLHVGGMAPNLTESLAFFEARFAGLPLISSCWRL
ncbi:MAG: lipase family protein [Actinomycetia bacterium]|nr:lipase family protein [Actinomycetes bacterium]